MSPHPLRNIPSIHELLEHPALKTLAERLHPAAVLSTVRVVLDEVAAEVHTAATEKSLPSAAELVERITRRVLESQPPDAVRAVNATGALHHGELGSPPWADTAIEALADAARGYSLRRSGWPVRAIDGHDVARQRLRELTGAEEALVFDSAAAAAMATFSAIAGRREIVVARQDVLRRGADYHIAELAGAAAVPLREVGAANELRLDDYRRAVGESSGAILLVHRGHGAAAPVNGDVDLATLVHLGREKRLPVVHDLGPAGLVDLAPLGVHFAPLVARSIEAGADLVVFSHEMLGGPRVGIVAGRRAMIEKIEAHPAARATRACGPILAALSATLALMGSADETRRDIPLVQLLVASPNNLKNRAERMAPQMAAAASIDRAEVVEASGTLGGSCPAGDEMPGWAVALYPRGASVAQMADALGRGEPAVIGVAEADRLLLNLRSVLPESDMRLVAAVEGLDRVFAKGKKQ
ncbi:MAG TPA: L-seryl-tRNA(Sec) selenium transferase [Thermoguttaceae bacterium]|nr:L-seryl-tRNA(Sec) selenium transferase [Thermoguttaceae bacterium]